MENNCGLGTLAATAVKMNPGDRSPLAGVSSRHYFSVGWEGCYKVTQELKMIRIRVVRIEPGAIRRAD